MADKIAAALTDVRIDFSFPDRAQITLEWTDLGTRYARLRMPLERLRRALRVSRQSIAQACADLGAVKSSSSPEWVERGSGCSFEEGAWYLVGVGVVSRIRNKALRSVTAQNRGRAEISKVYEAVSAETMKRYMAVTVDDARMSETYEPPRRLTAAVLDPPTLAAEWTDETWGDYFARMRLPLDAVRKMNAKNRDLTVRERDFIDANLEKVCASDSSDPLPRKQ